MIDGWEEAPLGNYVDSISETYKFSTDEFVIFLNTSDILNGKVLQQDLQPAKGLPGQAKKRIRRDDLLFSEIRPANGRYALINFDADKFVVSTKLMVLRCSEGLEPKYLELFLTSKRQIEYLQMLAEARSGTFPQITFDNIRTIEFARPPAREQKAIAEVLSSLDEKIGLLHRQNATLEALAETLFRQYFVEKVPNDWKEGHLADYADNIKSSVRPEKIDPTLPYIALEHIGRRNVALNDQGDAASVESNKYAFNQNDILFGKLRPYFHKVCFAPFSGICSTDILVIRPKEVEQFAFVLFAFFQDAVVDYSYAGSTGTRMPRTNWDDLSSYPILCPPEGLITQFGLEVAPGLEKIGENILQIQTLAKLRNTLLPKLMTGEVRVQFDGAQ